MDARIGDGMLGSVERLGTLPVIVNAHAGAGTRAEELRRLFLAAGANAQLELVRSGEELLAAAQRLASRRSPVIAVAGGDGSLGTVASALADSDTALGVLPTGTLNHFARDMHIPLDLAEAVRIIVAGHLQRIDLGEVNGKVFLNNSSVGLYASMVRHRSRRQKQWGMGKWRAMFWACMTVLRRSPFLRLELGLDGDTRQCRTPVVFVGNNAYRMEGFGIGTRQNLDQGQLSIYYAQCSSRRALLRLALMALLGKLRQAREFETVESTSLHIENRHRRLLVATDGEVNAMTTPLHYRIRRAALLVVAPRKATTPSTSRD